MPCHTLSHALYAITKCNTVKKHTPTFMHIIFALLILITRNAVTLSLMHTPHVFIMRSLCCIWQVFFDHLHLWPLKKTYTWVQGSDATLSSLMSLVFYLLCIVTPFSVHILCMCDCQVCMWLCTHVRMWMSAHKFLLLTTLNAPDVRAICNTVQYTHSVTTVLDVLLLTVTFPSSLITVSQK